MGVDISASVLGSCHAMLFLFSLVIHLTSVKLSATEPLSGHGPPSSLALAKVNQSQTKMCCTQSHHKLLIHQVDEMEKL